MFEQNYCIYQFLGQNKTIFRPPKIILENSRGISNAVIAELQVQLEEKAKKLQGEEMIFQLAQYVQEFLHHHNKPGIKSFYEEMLKRQREEKKAEQLEKDREVRRNNVSVIKYSFLYF